MYFQIIPSRIAVHFHPESKRVLADRYRHGVKAAVLVHVGGDHHTGEHCRILRTISPSWLGVAVCHLWYWYPFLAQFGERSGLDLKQRDDRHKIGVDLVARNE